MKFARLMRAVDARIRGGEWDEDGRSDDRKSLIMSHSEVPVPTWLA